MIRSFLLGFLLSALVVWVAACAPPSSGHSGAGETLAAAPTAVLSVATVTPNPTAQPEPTATAVPKTTPSPLPPTATPSPTLTPSPAPTATSTPAHPLSIAYLRQQDYPGAGLTIERELKPGANYDRFLASYLSEGNKNFALLTIPQGEKPESGWPVIIFNHGYIPPEIYRTTERYVAYVDAFARNGYIVFRPDYRGHGNSEGEPKGAYGDPGYTIDVLNAVTAMKNFPEADPDRIGMWGHSMGGFITLRSMLVDDAIRAGVIWSGVVGSYEDIVFNWHRDGQFPIPASIPERALRWRNDLVDEYGLPEENPEFWAAISANAFLDELSGPVQIHHGTKDKVVPLDFSTQLFTQIQDVGGVVEYFEWKGADHNISQRFNPAMRESLRFFDTYVKGE